MKPLKAFITKDNIHRVNVSVWPNPYNLSGKDQKGRIKNVPLEIITLMLKEVELQKLDRNLNDLQKWGVDGAFDWFKTEDGLRFWNPINNGNYKVFYDKYTPELLRKRLKE